MAEHNAFPVRWVPHYGFSKFYGYIMVKSTLLLIPTHHNFSTFLNCIFQCYDEQNSDFYSYLKLFHYSHCTHCIHAVHVKNSHKSCCFRNQILLVCQKLCMHFKIYLHSYTFSCFLTEIISVFIFSSCWQFSICETLVHKTLKQYSFKSDGIFKRSTYQEHF